MTGDVAGVVRRLVAAEHRGTEADIQATVRDLLLHGGLDLADAHLRLEAPAHNRRRIDIEVGATVIEVKKDLTRATVVNETQLAGYLRDREEADGDHRVGILTDGIRWHAYRLDPAGELRRVAEHVVSATPDTDALLVWLDGIIATRQHIAPSQQEVAVRLGSDSSATQLALSELAWVYEQCRDDPGVQLKRELWARLLTTAFGTSFDADDTELFLEHTYLVVLAEMVAHATLGFDLAAGAIEPDDLLAGRAFASRQVLGVVESDFFDWPADTTAGRVWVNNLARRVARFSWTDVEHDVLKALYESVIGPDTRHALGEYYTPDWLAREIVRETVDDPLRQRVLDPACGSGTFVYWAVRHCLEACETAGMTTAEAITSVTSRVFGVDIHPVAVALARVTYLLAIGPERLSSERPRFAVPVWLGDSVQYRRTDTLHDADALTIYADDGAELFTAELRFPDRVIDDIRWFDSLVTEMTDRAANRAVGSAVPDLSAVYDRHGVHDNDRTVLNNTLSTLCRLCDEGRNHIWGYFVRNEARPRWLSRPGNRVDRIVSNAPWLSYRYMTADTQSRFRELSLQRGLWHGAAVATHQDLSALFVARAVEQYLVPGGRFGILMPLAVLTRNAYVGFRSGRWLPEGISTMTSTASTATLVDFDPPWDLHDILPRIFPVPSAAVFGIRAERDAGPMPRKGVAWSGRQPEGTQVTDSLTTEDVPLPPMPTSDDEWSHYRARFYQGATLVPRSLAMVQRDDAGPLGTAAGSSAVTAQRSNLEKKPWKDLPTLTGIVEDRFIYGVHLGPTIYPFRTEEPELAVLPWTGERLLSADDPDLDRWPGFARWWAEANGRWETHRTKSGEAFDLGGYFDYHGKLASQASAMMETRVVYTKSGQYLASAIVDDPRTFIDHKLYWCQVRNHDEALYLTGVLNAPVLNARLAPMQARGEHNPRDIDKYVWALPVPRFDGADPFHQQLCGLAVEAEAVAAEVDTSGMRFEHGRREIRRALVAAGIAARLDTAVDRLLLVASGEG